MLKPLTKDASLALSWAWYVNASNDRGLSLSTRRDILVEGCGRDCRFDRTECYRLSARVSQIILGAINACRERTIVRARYLIRPTSHIDDRTFWQTRYASRVVTRSITGKSFMRSSSP